MAKYNPQKIEKKWQGRWEKQNSFKAQNNSKKKKFYLLVEFPYPSGDGLHVGHCRPYIALDTIARKKRMQGYNVLFPIGWDAFGLPTENYAIKKGIHPAVATKKNTDNFRKQIKNLGVSFDWSREVNTTDPEYYRWTQWIFLQLFKNGLAYKAKIAINWCPSCKIGLANEEVVLGKCERCGTKVEKKEKEQWLIKITEYAERLIEDLSLVDYLEKIKIQQKEWIGKSQGALVKFPIEGGDDFIEVFTTRIDTIFSGTFLILAPEHKFIDKYKDKIQNIEEIIEYRNLVKDISDIERANEKKSVTGVELKGILARNPATGEAMPVWIADFVLEGYGTGAVFADAHDKRDFELAKKMGIPLRTSIEPTDKSIAAQVKTLEICFEEEGTLYNSMQFDGLSSADARPKIISWLEEKGAAQIKTSYKLRDWVFSRQHYWGEPIPLIFCEKCKKESENLKLKNQNLNFNKKGELLNPGWIAVQENKLPVELPKVKNYKPTATGESPLAEIKNWVNVKCPRCGSLAKRETDTMPNWAGSNWYYLAYTITKNKKYNWDEKKMKYWMPVDWYNGGMEHTTLHLLYSRFIFKFLWDIGAVPKSIGSEPYKKRTSHGMVLGEGGIKMSKSKGNVINPDKVAKEFGSDTLRIYEMFMGPFDQMIPWDTKGVVGSRRFLEKIYKLSSRENSSKNKDLKKALHKTIKKVTEDIDAMKFNTAISSMMEFVNAWNISNESLDKDSSGDFLKILSPFAPHLSEELWFMAGLKGLCCNQKWPKYNAKLIEEEKIILVVQVNGKVRDKIEVDTGITQKEAEKIVLKREKIKQWLDGKTIKKVIFIPCRLLNFVIADSF